MQLFSLKEMPSVAKVLLLKELSYGTDGEFVLDASGKKVLDKYIEFRVDNMVILPDSEIILDDNELSIYSYLEEYGDVF
jgi:hypothetical protein